MSSNVDGYERNKRIRKIEKSHSNCFEASLTGFSKCYGWMFVIWFDAGNRGRNGKVNIVKRCAKSSLLKMNNIVKKSKGNITPTH